MIIRVKCAALIMFYLCSNYILAQGIFNPDSAKKNIITVSADKVINVFTFNGKADLFIGSKYGDFSITQNYKGNSILTLINVMVNKELISTTYHALREDEDLKIGYSLPLNDVLYFTLNQRTLISSEDISGGMNDLRRINGQAGLKYLPDNDIYLDFSAGIENNKSLGIETSGELFNFSGYTRNLDIFDVNTNSMLTGEMLNYHDGRKYLDITLNADAVKYYEDNGSIGFSINYKKQDRDLLVPRFMTQSSFPLERRFEDRFGADFRIGFMLFDPLSTNFNFSINNHTVDRQYNHSIDNVELSYVSRNLREFRMSFGGSLEYRTEDFRQALTLSYDSRDERNKVKNLFGLEETKDANLRNLEYQRDNITSITRLNTATTWETNATDTLVIDYAMSLLRYDTPSKDNYDERDQFNLMFKTAYLMEFSENLKAGVTAEIQLNHLVNLKARLSAGNYWNRVIRLAPEFRYRTKYFAVAPVFEILANYTVYDYELSSSGTRSYSLRQVSYRDSLYVPLQSGYSLQAGIILKYYENGQLLWKSFSESPQRRNFEKFAKLMLIKTLDNLNFFGCGLRYYNFESANIGNSNVAVTFINNPVTSYGLEAIINFNMFNNSKISLQGWYEFQKVSNKGFKTFPNFFILTVINL